MPDASTMTENFPLPGDDAGPICIVANPKSGRNSRDDEALEAVREALGAEVCAFRKPAEMQDAIDRALSRNPRMIVSAGGDGTAMAVAGRLVGKGVPLAVLPMGTFNYFARGMGLSEDPVEAARQIADGEVAPRHIGAVNGQVFLNNASAGIYPSILKERENVYRHWGRRRIMAHWSVVKTFFRFRRPMRVTLTIDGEPREMRTPLVFVGRSAFQLERFGLNGADAVRNGEFAVFVMRADTRWQLFGRTLRLALGTIEEGRDYDLYRTGQLTLEVPKRRKVLMAYDGEKSRMEAPLEFRMTDEPLCLVVPRSRAE